ncbi:diuretic hormone receptor-like isoform X4 [Belonocnema kinseyi]|uniref:diuretic hormone receptor-like isoform X4 n=1 Tax=Belonocnema kinseyi TaxID=2817044 RepID=UPI00143D64A4|nr:diuretic hormone receptor-like isoform X4 [Belonocnema kinseyi]
MESTSVNESNPLEGNYVLDLLNHINQLNDSQSRQELECRMKLLGKRPSRGCDVYWDSLLCWPHTQPGAQAILPCFEELNGIRYDINQNASRWCMQNGTWDSYSNYSQCLNVLPKMEAGVEITTMIYIIGYSLSLISLIVAVSIFLYYKELRCLRNSIHTHLMLTYILADFMWIVTTIMQNVALWRHCPWLIPHPYDWFYQAPAIVVLCINVIFLFMIMWVLITKLRSANNVETQQYRKASKALLVLIPLLGVTYVLVLAGPEEGQVANVFTHSRAFLLSSQGLSVALFYCFLNTEVQNTVRHHFNRWSTARNLGTDRRYYNNWSPRSRTESIRHCFRLYCQPTDRDRKRESIASETTTTTMVGPNSTTAFLDKSSKIIAEE